MKKIVPLIIVAALVLGMGAFAAINYTSTTQQPTPPEQPTQTQQPTQPTQPQQPSESGEIKMTAKEFIDLIHRYLKGDKAARRTLIDMNVPISGTGGYDIPEPKDSKPKTLIITNAFLCSVCSGSDWVLGYDKNGNAIVTTYYSIELKGSPEEVFYDEDGTISISLPETKTVWSLSPEIKNLANNKEYPKTIEEVKKVTVRVEGVSIEIPYYGSSELPYIYPELNGSRITVTLG